MERRFNVLTKKYLAASAIAVLFSSTVVVLANDIVIVGGRVIDPETRLDGIRNVAIQGDKIVAISEFPLEGDVVIDATGHVVTPGFIDLHAHGQNIGDYRMQVTQGVTTSLELESGVLPIADWYDTQATKNLPHCQSCGRISPAFLQLASVQSARQIHKQFYVREEG
jgi:predicted amidohydrolase